MRFFSLLLTLWLLLLPFSGALAVEKGYTVFHGDRSKPKIAVTVDDCYDIDHVKEMLTLCEENAVPVTFFVIGSALKYKDQPTWQRALELGCEIGNHTWGHKVLPDLNQSKIKFQLERTQQKLDALLGYSHPMRVMRPPYGKLSNNPKLKSEKWVVEAIEAAGYAHAVRWDVSQTDPDKAIKQVQNGSILLYHANPKDIRCLSKLIPMLKAKGYNLVTVSELLGLE